MWLGNVVAHSDDSHNPMNPVKGRDVVSRLVMLYNVNYTTTGGLTPISLVF